MKIFNLKLYITNTLLFAITITLVSCLGICLSEFFINKKLNKNFARNYQHHQFLESSNHHHQPNSSPILDDYQSTNLFYDNFSKQSNSKNLKFLINNLFSFEFFEIVDSENNQENQSEDYKIGLMSKLSSLIFNCSKTFFYYIQSAKYHFISAVLESPPNFKFKF